MPQRRYLLSASADATVAVFDTQGDPYHDIAEQQQRGQQHAAALSAWREPELRPLLHIGRQQRGMHAYLVSSVCWYPIDNGLFVTGSYDQRVKVWDTNWCAWASWVVPMECSRREVWAATPCA